MTWTIELRQKYVNRYDKQRHTTWVLEVSLIDVDIHDKQHDECKKKDIHDNPIYKLWSVERRDANYQYVPWTARSETEGCGQTCWKMQLDVDYRDESECLWTYDGECMGWSVIRATRCMAEHDNHRRITWSARRNQCTMTWII